jgi:hypothetical protein
VLAKKDRAQGDAWALLLDGLRLNPVFLSDLDALLRLLLAIFASLTEHFRSPLKKSRLFGARKPNTPIDT